MICRTGVRILLKYSIIPALCPADSFYIGLYLKKCNFYKKPLEINS